MPWYVVWKDQQGKVCGFITKKKMPIEWETEEGAQEAMKDHVLELVNL